MSQGHAHPHPTTGGDEAPQRFGLRVAVGSLTLALLALYSAAVAVEERHTALVTRFGKLVRTVDDPGLHWKLPWPIETATSIDRRTRVLSTRHTETLTKDRRNVVLQTFVAWNVADPERYFRAVGGSERADEILGDQMSAAKAAVLAQNDLAALVSTDPSTLRTRAIEDAIAERVRATARDEYGIAIESVGIKRLSFPESNIAAVFEQMRADRKREADALRAAGQADADKIRSDTEREIAQMLAEATKESQRIKGQGQAELAEALATVRDLDPEFFAFMVKLESLGTMITDNAALYFQTGTAPFDIFEDGFGDATFVDPSGEVIRGPSGSSATGSTSNDDSND